jgi:hypothetical protein
MSTSANTRNAASPSSNTPAGTPANPDTKHYFDIHATGVGYLNRVRTVPVKGKGNDYLAVDIGALRGEQGKVEYTYFSCRVSGAEAQRVIREDLAEHIQAGKKVLIRFKIGDLTPDSFTYSKGPRQGQTGLNIKSHLLIIYSARVDGECVYRAPSREDASASSAVENATPAAGPSQPQPKVFTKAQAVSSNEMDESEVDAVLLALEAEA